MSLPEPYWQSDDGRLVLYLGDCREIAPLLQPVDVVVTDPPYGETSLAWDARADESWLPVVRPLLKAHGSVWFFASMRLALSMAAHRAFDGWRFAQDLVWEKHNGSIFHADRFRRVHEHILQLYPDGAIWGDLPKAVPKVPGNGNRTVRRKQRPAHSGAIGEMVYRSLDGGPRLMRSVLRVRSCHGAAIHPTEKPVGALRPLIEYSCPPDGVVLDPFAGSASALVAAGGLGRRAIGVERREGYAEAAADRLRRIARQSVMSFGEAAS